MDESKWTEYQNYITTALDKALLKLQHDSNSININCTWHTIKSITLKAAKSHILYHKTCLQNVNLKSKQLTDLYQQINTLNKIFHAFQKSTFGNVHYTDRITWLSWYNKVKTICRS